MEKSKKVFTSVLLLVLSVGLCLAQHWSFGLQPGGKRSSEDSFQEMAKEMEELGEVQHSECPGSSQHSRIRDLKEAMENLMEGEGRRKI
ncbi:progonadoliberin-1 [Neopelma chrysocephalum]|uniref:progonadoliberin-1 n=1 Tax=Neopelma chrysocephalum TaxID=114329 RepID=UPI000FCD377E|nr:progonadoliberin-1 [Neopelma chrysocephalum]